MSNTMSWPDEARVRLRRATRKHLAEVWRAYRAGQPLQGADRIFAKCMAEHPEWEDWFERVDSAEMEDGEFLSQEGIQPFAAVGVEATVEWLVGPEARETYDKLREEGLDHREARAELARVLLGVLWMLDYGSVPANEGIELFHGILRRVAEGERAVDIFE